MLAGRICSKSLTNLILQEDNLNEFAYTQVLLFYKNSFEQRRKDSKEKLFFEQDGATAHISSSNKKLINKLFGKWYLIQNPPNSPDLAYPIENIWAYIWNKKIYYRKMEFNTNKDLYKHVVIII